MLMRDAREAAGEDAGSSQCSQDGRMGQECHNCDKHCGASGDAPAEEPLRRLLPTASELSVGASWGCLSAWVFMCFKSLNIYTGAGESLLDTTYLVSIVTICATLFAAAHFDAFTERCMTRTVFRWVLPAGMSASTLLMASGIYAPAPFDTAVACTAGVLSGIFSGLFLLRIALAFTKLCLRACVICAAVGVVLQPLLFTLFLLFGSFEGTAFAASIPIVSSMLLVSGMRELERRGVAPGMENDCLGDAQGVTERGAAIAADAPLGPRERSKISVKLTMGGALVGFASEAARTIYVQLGLINQGATFYACIEGAGWLVATCVVVAIVLVLLTLKTERMARNCYHALMIMLVLGIILLPVASLHGGIATEVGQAVNSAAYSCFAMLIWVVTVSFAARHSNASIRIIAHARAGWAAGPLVGMLLGRFVLRALGLGIDGALLVMGLGVLAILFGIGFAFTETDLVRCMDILPMQRKQRFRDKCLRTARDHALSERETEVMILLAKGNNLACVQDNLLMSKSTASTHRQHIYRKLDIHSQQELIDLVEARG